MPVWGSECEKMGTTKQEYQSKMEGDEKMNDEEERARWIDSNGNVTLFSHLTYLRCKRLNYKSATADGNIISAAFLSTLPN